MAENDCEWSKDDSSCAGQNFVVDGKDAFETRITSMHLSNGGKVGMAEKENEFAMNYSYVTR